jgi:hypothetical protein
MAKPPGLPFDTGKYRVGAGFGPGVAFRSTQEQRGEGNVVMSETSTFSSQAQQLRNGDNGAPAQGRRLLSRPSTAETERIARACPPDGLSVPVIVDAIRRETGCSRATAYRAVADAFAGGILSRTED